MTQNRKLLQNPQGSEGLLFKEAYRHLKLIEKLSHEMVLWGYLPAHTPMFDYYEVYKDELVNPDEVYRLFDRSGELLLLRSDITLFLAKQMAASLNRNKIPARFFYADSIVRHEEFTDMSHNEYFQTGAELLGVPGIQGDMEVLSLLLSLMNSIECEGYLHIGSRALFDAVFPDSSFTKEERQELLNAIEKRDSGLAKTVLSNTSAIKTADKEESFSFFKEVFGFIGELKEYGAFIDQLKLNFPKWVSSQVQEELTCLRTKIEALLSGFPKNKIRVDLSETGFRPYYSGISFKYYTDESATAVASGGRYDNLLKKFGFDCPSVGFSIQLRKVESAIPQKEFQIPSAEKIGKNNSQFSVETYLSALKEGEKLRKQGKTVTLC